MFRTRCLSHARASVIAAELMDVCMCNTVSQVLTPRGPRNSSALSSKPPGYKLQQTISVYNFVNGKHIFSFTKIQNAAEAKLREEFEFYGLTDTVLFGAGHTQHKPQRCPAINLGGMCYMFLCATICLHGRITVRVRVCLRIRVCILHSLSVVRKSRV